MQNTFPLACHHQTNATPVMNASIHYTFLALSSSFSLLVQLREQETVKTQGKKISPRLFPWSKPPLCDKFHTLLGEIR